MIGTLRLRITVEGPPPGVTIQVQRGRDQLLPPSRSNAQALSFDLEMRLGEPRTPGQLRFLGEYAQGPADDRFVYVNSGKLAGEAGSCWERRAKVKLAGITASQAKRVLDDASLVLEARIGGRAGDGGPMCATVPLLGAGWAVAKAR